MLPSTVRHSTTRFTNESRVLITRYPRMLKLLHPEDYDYFRVLRAKLYWSTNY